MQKGSKKTLADETDKLVHHIIEQGVDGIIGGFPCQDISVAGKRKGIQRNASGDATNRSGLFWEMVRTVRMVRPKYWLMENVAELLNGYMGDVLGEVACIGYDAEWDSISAGQCGAPHERERVYVLAYPCGNGGKGMFPKPLQRQQDFQRFEDIRSIEDMRRRPVLSQPPICRSYPGLAARLHAIGNGNPPCIIRELTKGLK